MKPAGGSWDWLDAALQQLTGDGSDAPSRQSGHLETYGEGIEALNRIGIRDCGETLVDLRSVVPPLAFCQAHPWGAAYRRHFYVRQTVAGMLCAAQQRLPNGYRLLIIEGFRPALLQRRLYQGLFCYLQALYPDWDEDQLREATNVLIAAPELDAPPHSTGGAVDLTLVDAAGRPLDMTAPLRWCEASAPTECAALGPEACANRQILIEALSSTGLTNYPGEWWHWSYGEPGWAVRTDRTEAIYGSLASPFATPAG